MGVRNRTSAQLRIPVLVLLTAFLSEATPFFSRPGYAEGEKNGAVSAIVTTRRLKESPSSPHDSWSTPDRLAQSTVTPSFDPITFNDTLSEADEQLQDGSYYQGHTFEGTEGQTLVIEMTSQDFDTYLILLDSKGRTLTNNDDGLNGTNSHILIQLPATGTYTILANSYGAGATGRYQLQVRSANSTDLALTEAMTLDQQVNELAAQERYDEAIPLAERSLQIQEQALGDNHPIIANSLNRLAILYLELPDVTRAEPLLQRALQIREATLGENHPEVATLLNNLAGLYFDEGNYAEAEPLFLRALQIREQHPGDNLPDLAANLANLGSLYSAQSNYAEAEPFYQRAIELQEQIFGDTHPTVANTLTTLAGLYVEQARYAEAEPLLRRSITIQEQTLGSTHPALIKSLNTLARLYMEQGDYPQAEPLLQRSLAIGEQAFGETHINLATSLNNLGLLYKYQGDYDRAEQFYRRSLQIREQALGANHPMVATSLNNLALLYQEMGDYPQAELLYRRTLTIEETVYGNNHPEVATTLNNLAGLYRIQGNSTQAEPLYRRVIQIREATLGNSHPSVAESLNNLAVLYQNQGNYSQAEALLLRSLQISEEVFGENHPTVADSLNNLATLYYEEGNLAEAEPLFVRSLQIAEQIYGENSIDVAITLNNLGILYRDQQDYAQAASIYRRSLQSFEQTLGENHPNTAVSLLNLAQVSWLQDDFNQVLPLFEQALAIEENTLEQTFSLGSEARKRVFLATLQDTTDRVLSLHLQDMPTDAHAAQLAFTTLLRRKGRVLDSVTDTVQRLRQHLSPEDQVLLADLQVKQAQLASLIYSGLGDRPPADYQAQVTELRSQIETLENTLAQRSVEFRVEAEPVTVEAIAALIPDDTVLIEWVHYRPLTDALDQGDRWGEPRYAAYLLDSNGTIQWVDLGEATVIDGLVNQYRDALRRQNFQIGSIARDLDAQIMAPIRAKAGDARHLLLSPDGALNLIPFAALVDEGNRYLIETYTLTYLTSGRDLLRLQWDIPSRQPPVLIANPDYNGPGDSTPIQLATAIPGDPSTRNTNPAFVGNQRSVDLSAQQFGALPGTAAEANAILPLLPNAELLTGSQATENALKQLQGPQLLHIATHGFFFRDVEFVPPPDPSLPSRALSGSDLTSTNENPLLRSGLALAGFNPRQSGQEDGVLTALEASSLDLQGTQLVVLSACDTGLGDIVNGEGVYGLRRAFVMAGAESQVMSLWKVDDYATSTLMTHYYERLQQGEGRSEAFRQVQLELVRSPEYNHPYFWAAFIFSGDWHPLE